MQLKFLIKGKHIKPYLPDYALPQNPHKTYKVFIQKQIKIQKME